MYVCQADANIDLGRIPWKRRGKSEMLSMITRSGTRNIHLRKNLIATSRPERSGQIHPHTPHSCSTDFESTALDLKPLTPHIAIQRVQRSSQRPKKAELTVQRTRGLLPQQNLAQRGQQLGPTLMPRPLAGPVISPGPHIQQSQLHPHPTSYPIIHSSLVKVFPLPSLPLSYTDGISNNQDSATPQSEFGGPYASSAAFQESHPAPANPPPSAQSGSWPPPNPFSKFSLRKPRRQPSPSRTSVFFPVARWE